MPSPRAGVWPLASRRLGTGVSGGVGCIGYGENDLPMFRVSTRKIALENSVEALKREADHVAGKPDGDGAAEAIDELMLGGTRPVRD